MEALRDPFSRVHPFFWPVLWLSLRAFVRWTRRMIEEGHGFAGLRVELTWYGWIHVEAIDLSEVGADFRRHILGAGRGNGWSVLQRASMRVETLFAKETADACEGRYPWTTLSTSALPAANDPWIPAFTGICGNTHSSFQNGTGPPLGPAPVPCVGGGAPLSLPFAPDPRPARAPVLVI